MRALEEASMLLQQRLRRASDERDSLSATLQRQAAASEGEMAEAAALWKALESELQGERRDKARLAAAHNETSSKLRDMSADTLKFKSQLEV